MLNSFTNKHVKILWRFLLTLSIAGFFHMIILLILPGWQVDSSNLIEPKTLDVTLSAPKSETGSPTLSKQSDLLVQTSRSKKSTSTATQKQEPKESPPTQKAAQHDQVLTSDATSQHRAEKNTPKSRPQAKIKNNHRQSNAKTKNQNSTQSNKRTKERAEVKKSVDRQVTISNDTPASERLEKEQPKIGSETDTPEKHIGANENQTEEESYIRKIQRIIRNNRLLDFNIYAGSKAKNRYKSVYRIKLLSNGAVMDVKILKYGKRRDFALRGRQAIFDSSPFPRPPEEDAEKSYTYEIGMIWIAP